MGGAIAIGYIVLLLGYGLVRGGRSRSFDDFAGGAVSPSTLVLCASMCASFIGGGFSLGNAERAFSFGIADTVLLMGFSVGQFVVGWFLAPRFSAFSGVRSAGGVIGQAFGPKARMLCGLLSALFCAGVLGAQLGAIGSVAGALFSLPPRLCSAVGFVVLIIYTTLGGLRASLKSDALQITVLAVGFLVALAAALTRAGGFSGLTDGLDASYFQLPGRYGGAEFAALFLTYFLGEMLCPPASQRMLLSKDPARVRRATLLSAVVSLPFFVVTGLLGLLARRLAVTQTPAFALPELTRAVLPSVLSAVLIAAMLCVYLSSGGSFLGSCTTALCDDVLQPLGRLPKDGARRLRLARLINILCGGAALVAATALESVLAILVLSYSFWAPVVLVPLVAALLGFRGSERSFFIPALCGAAGLLVWRVLGGPFGISPIVVGFLANLFAFIFIKKEKEVQT